MRLDVWMDVYYYVTPKRLDGSELVTDVEQV